MTEIETAWLAGLLEGEGCFGDNHRGGVKIQVTMTDKDVVERVAQFFGKQSVSCYDKKLPPNRKPRYYVQIGGQRCVEIMTAVLPHMGERRSAMIRRLLWERSKAPGRGAHSRARTACPYGHPLDGVQIGKRGKKFRYCKTCRRQYQAARQEEIRAARAAAGLQEG